MQVVKKCMLFTATTIVSAYLIIWCLNAFGFRNPIFAFLINWIAMSWVAIVGQAFRFSLPSSYYGIKTFEQAGQIYEYLGISLFKSLVRRGPLSIFSPTLRFSKNSTITSLQYLDHEMRKAETGHMFIFILILLFIGYALLRGWLDAVGWILMFNIVINGYPIMLQRYNRIKLQELIQRQVE